MIAKEPIKLSDSFVYTSTSARNGLIGVWYGVRSLGLRLGQGRLLAYANDQNTYSAELYAIAEGLRLVKRATNQRIIIQSSCLAALQSIQNPRQQSRQTYLRKIYESAETMFRQGCSMQAQWIPTKNQEQSNKVVKAHAKETTRVAQGDLCSADE